MQNHYVCAECHAVSKLASNCQNDNCLRQGMRMAECHCDDGLHEMVIHPQTEELSENIAKQTEEAKKNDYSVNMLDLDDQDLNGTTV